MDDKTQGRAVKGKSVFQFIDYLLMKFLKYILQIVIFKMMVQMYVFVLLCSYCTINN